MTPERLDLLKQAFQMAFGMPFEEGLKEVRHLTRNYMGLAKMNPHLERAALAYGVRIDQSSVRMSERDFAMVAFFALAGLESMDEPTEWETIRLGAGRE